MDADGIQRNCTMAYILFTFYIFEFLQRMTAPFQGGTREVGILLLCVWTVGCPDFFCAQTRT